MISTMTTVLCPECRRENECERVYCHDCGARLIRPKVAARKDDTADTRKRMQKMFDPHGVQMRQLFFKMSKVILGAFGAAIFLLIALPPDVPPATKTVSLASQLGLDLERATSRHQAVQLNFTEAQVNVFLESVLKTKKKSLDQPLLDFHRALVGFHEGTCSVTMERSLFGYSLYTTIDAVPTVAGGNVSGTIKSGRIGRLPIHPQVARFMGSLFTDLWSALDREKKLVAKMGAIEFHDDTVTLTVAP